MAAERGPRRRGAAPRRSEARARLGGGTVAALLAVAALGAGGVFVPAAAQTAGGGGSPPPGVATRTRPEPPRRPTTCHNYGAKIEISGMIARLPGEGPGSDPRTRRVWVMQIDQPICMRAVGGEPGMDLPRVPTIQLVLKPEDFPRWQRELAMSRLRATGKLVARQDPNQRSLVVLEVTRLEAPPRP